MSLSVRSHMVGAETARTLESPHPSAQLTREHSALDETRKRLLGFIAGALEQLDGALTAVSACVAMRMDEPNFRLVRIHGGLRIRAVGVP